VTEEQRQRKIEQIARLSLDEIDGWLFGIKVAMRAPFDGEMSALAARKRELIQKGRAA
jgi:hypothetical protein